MQVEEQELQLEVGPHVINKIVKEKYISFIVMVRNQANNIQNCLDSIYDCADEIIVVDTGSIDATLNILHKKSLNNDKLKLFRYKWQDNFSDVRNFSLKQATCDWVFFIDADEILDEKRDSLCRYLKSFKNWQRPVISVFRTSKLDVGETYEYEDRIFRNDGMFHFYGYVHEEIRFANNGVPKKIKSNIKVKHCGYLSSELSKHDKLKRNTHYLLKNINEEPDNQRWLYLLSRDGQGILDSKEIISIVVSGLLDGNSEFSRVDIFSIPHSCYKKDLIINLCLLYIDIHDLNRAEILMSIFNSDESNNDPDVLYCQMIIKVINLYEEKLSLLHKFVLSRNNIAKQKKISKLDAMNHHLDDIMAYLLFDTKNYAISKDYFKLLKDDGYNTLFLDESNTLFKI